MDDFAPGSVYTFPEHEAGGESREKVEHVLQQVETVVVGQHRLVQKILWAVLADGHVLLEGVPGLAKTLVISALARACGGVFRRIQLLPDLMPSDITGTLMFRNGSGTFEVYPGPIIGAHFVLADEINRTPPKVQAAFLQAMQEREVTIGPETFAMRDPFCIFATQNPLEQEGTYPLPEAQLDRFLMKLHVGYPSEADELAMLNNPELDRRDPLEGVVPVTAPEELIAIRQEIKRGVFVSEAVKGYIVRLVRATRQPRDVGGLQEFEGVIQAGASPRGGTMNLRNVARVHAFLDRRSFVLPDDVRAILPDVLRHRVVLTFRAESNGVTVDEVLRRLLECVEIP
jgi:MoxR-like ATPase